MALTRYGTRLSFRLICQFNKASLGSALVSIGVDADKVLGQETAEGIHVLLHSSEARSAVLRPPAQDVRNSSGQGRALFVRAGTCLRQGKEPATVPMCLPFADARVSSSHDMILTK